MKRLGEKIREKYCIMYMEKKSTNNIVKKSRAQLRFSKGKGKAVILMVIKMFCKKMTRLNP